MIEKELQFIADFTLNKVKNLGSFFTYRKLLNTDIHPAILKYISADVDFKIYEDRKKLLQQSNFDYSGFEISKYFDLISQQIKKKTKINYDDIKSLVAEAAAFNAQFTVKPNWTLIKFIFNDKRKLSVDEIKMKLDCLYYYSYFSEVLNVYFTKAKLLSINSEEFKNIIKKLDQTTFLEKKEELVKYSLNSIADFYNVGSKDKSKIAVIHVEDFLRDKGLNDYLEKLNHGFHKQSKQTYEIKDFIKVLFSTEPVKTILNKLDQTKVEDELIEFEEDVPDKPAEENDSKPLVEKEMKVNKQKVDEGSEFEISEQENLDPLYNFDEDKEFIEDEHESEELETKELIDKEIEKSNEFELSSSEDAPIRDNEQNNKINFSDEITEDIELSEDLKTSKKEEKSKIFEPSDQGSESKHKDKPKEKIEEGNEKTEIQEREKDLFYYLSNREIEKIVASIFNDDREDFATTMERISESKSYESATDILKKIFKSYNINPYSRDAVTLTNCVSNYFEQN